MGAWVCSIVDVYIFAYCVLIVGVRECANVGCPYIMGTPGCPHVCGGCPCLWSMLVWSMLVVWGVLGTSPTPFGRARRLGRACSRFEKRSDSSPVGDWLPSANFLFFMIRAFESSGL